MREPSMAVSSTGGRTEVGGCAIVESGVEGDIPGEESPDADEFALLR